MLRQPTPVASDMDVVSAADLDGLVGADLDEEAMAAAKLDAAAAGWSAAAADLGVTADSGSSRQWPAWPPPPQWGQPQWPQPKQPTGGNAHRSRLHVITITGTQDIERAALIQKSWKRWMGKQDHSTTVCDPGCSAKANNSLENVLEMEDSVFLHNKCRAHGKDCDGYHKSSMKYVWGLVHEVKRLKKEKSHMPSWWFIKDDDTYFHPERLIQAATGAGLGPEQLVAMGQGGDPGIQGGSGLLLSGALAEKIAVHYGDRWIKSQGMWIEKGSFYYDDHVKEVVGWVPGARFVSTAAFMDWCNYGCPDRSHLKCTQVGTEPGEVVPPGRCPHCSMMASIHLKYVGESYKSGMSMIDNCWHPKR